MKVEYHITYFDMIAQTQLSAIFHTQSMAYYTVDYLRQCEHIEKVVLIVKWIKK